MSIPVPNVVRFEQFREKYEDIRNSIPRRQASYFPNEGILYGLFLTFGNYDFNSAKFVDDMTDFLKQTLVISGQCQKYRSFDLFDIHDYAVTNKVNKPLLRIVPIDLTFFFQHRFINRINRYGKEANLVINNCSRDLYLGIMLSEYISFTDYQITPVKITVTFQGRNVGYQGYDKVPSEFYSEPQVTCTRENKRFIATFQPRLFPTKDDQEVVFNSGEFIRGFIAACREFEYPYATHLYDFSDHNGMFYDAIEDSS